eukprot:Colp12_sorted_trinity150504_noHs@25400
MRTQPVKQLEFMVQLLCGLRGAEATALRIWNVGLHKNHITIYIAKSKRDRKGKGFTYNLPRTTASGIPVYEILSEFMTKVCSKRKNRNCFLFSTDPDGLKQLSYTTHTRWFSKLHAKSG